MVKSLALMYWELQRLRRSRPTVVFMALVPAAGIAATTITQVTAMKCFFPAVAAVLAWGLIYIRSFSDRASGFALGVESTPAAGFISFSARVLCGVVIALAQSGVFYLSARLCS